MSRFAVAPCHAAQIQALFPTAVGNINTAQGASFEVPRLKGNRNTAPEDGIFQFAWGNMA